MADHNSITKELWRNALAPNSSEQDFPSVLYRELAEFVQLPLEEIEARGEASQKALNAEWDTGSFSDSKQFYRDNTTYLYNLIHWHANYGEATARVKVMRYLQANGISNTLDFGSGVGSTIILFARNGFNVSAADIAENLLAFARFRMERHGLNADYFDLNRANLPKARFDAVTAIDVLEHVGEPKVEITQIYESLKPGGLFCFNVCGSDGAPMHITEAEQVLSLMRMLGFVRVRQCEVPLFIYRKIPRSPANVIASLPSWVFYRLRYILRYSLTKLGLYQAVKKLLQAR